MGRPLIINIFRGKPDSKGRVWRWRVTGANNKKIGQATQAYSRRASAARAANRIATGGFAYRSRKK